MLKQLASMIAELMIAQNDHVPNFMQPNTNEETAVAMAANGSECRALVQGLVMIKMMVLSLNNAVLELQSWQKEIGQRRVAASEI